MTEEEFHGAKLAILSGRNIVTILRDEKPDIPWPGYWDLPGGAREPGETPEQTVLRELHEELGLTYTPEDLIWQKLSQAEQGAVWFFVAEKSGFDPAEVRFGDEGQT